MLSEAVNGRPSQFVWYEFHTPDRQVAENFYQRVLGWKTHDSGLPDRRYTLVSAGETPIGGVLEKPVASFAEGEKPGWLGYVGVNDVAGFSQRVKQAGGLVHRAVETIPGVGSFAVVADPQGAMFVLFQPPDGMQQPECPKAGTPGSAAWHDLIAIDWQAEFPFYSDLFGWSKSQTMDMGPNGLYQIFAAGAEPIGGMMSRRDHSQSPGWLFYFHVDEIGAAITRVKESGGTVVHGPSEVPGGQQVAHCLDSQGALFGIVSPSIVSSNTGSSSQ